MSSTVLEETLLAFSQKRVGPDQVMRALCEHSAWFAPLSYGYHALKTDKFDNVTLWGNQSQVAAGKLYLFSDATHGHLAASQVQLGPYVSPLSGAALFAFLPAGLTELYVNPASPMERRWYVGQGALALGALWGKAILLEQMLAGAQQGNLVDALLDFPAWTLFARENGAIATAVGAGGLQNPGMIFTTPDCAELALHNLGDQAKSLRRVTISGKELFTTFPRFGVDGFLINPFGPGVVRVFDARVCQGIIESLRVRDQA